MNVILYLYNIINSVISFLKNVFVIFAVIRLAIYLHKIEKSKKIFLTVSVPVYKFSLKYGKKINKPDYLFKIHGINIFLYIFHNKSHLLF